MRKLINLLTLTLATLGVLTTSNSVIHAQGTAFTYHGVLSTNGPGSPAHGSHDFAFTVFDASTNGSVVGVTIIRSNVMVDNGLFMEKFDFGTNVFTGPTRWLEIAVRPSGGGSLQLLSPRQEFTSTPYSVKAVVAENVTGKIPADQIEGKIDPELQIPEGGITLGKLSDSVVSNSFWRLHGNAGTTAANFLGTTDNQPLELRINNQRALRLEYGGAGVNLIVGSGVNSITGSDHSSVLGGWDNDILGNSDSSIIAGGHDNKISTDSDSSAIGGGANNFIAPFSTWANIGGGIANKILTNTPRGTIGGGEGNIIGPYANGAIIAGGNGNRISTNSVFSVVGGGSGNRIEVNSDTGVIGGGFNNIISSNTSVATISGGRLNRVFENSYDSTIAGGNSNEIGTNAYRSVISGGNDNTIAPNANLATIGGGFANIIGTNSPNGVIGGGYVNSIRESTPDATIAGGNSNEIGTDSDGATIGGGYDNGIAANSFGVTISGGRQNKIGNNSSYSSIGGGDHNDIGSNGEFVVVAGGYYNTIRANAEAATIAGGYANEIGTNALQSAIGGGYDNAILPGGQYATIPGGFQNAATNYAFAAGRQAKANHTGTFVWADAQNGDFASTSNHQFLIRASGGVGIGTNNPQSALHVRGVVTADGFVGDGSGLSNLVSYSVVTNNFAATNAISDNQLPASVARLNTNQTFTASNTFAGVVNATNVANQLRGTFTGTLNGNGAGVTNLNPANLTAGTAAINISGNATTATSATTAGSAGNFTGSLAGDVTGTQATTTVARLRGVNIDPTAPTANQHLRYNGANWIPGAVALGTDVSGILPVASGGTGAGTTAQALTNLGAASLTSSNVFSGVNTLTNTANTFVGNFHGNGANLTNLNVGSLAGVAYVGSNQTFTASNTFAGVVNATNVANQLRGTFTGTLNGNGAGLTNLNASQFTSGTVPDARLSNNIPRLNLPNTFTAAQVITNGGQIPLQVLGNDVGGTWINLANSSVNGRTWNFISSGVGNSEGAGKLLFRDTAQGVVMTLSSNGNVGIGTVSPTVKLEVIGTVKATDFIGGNTFVGNGTGLTNVNAETLDGLDSTAFWKLGGNNITSPTTQFFGSTNNQPVEFKANNLRALRIEPTTAESPNLVGGFYGNFASNGVVGAVIAGGGRNAITNIAAASYSTIGGGRGHLTAGLLSTISGGSRNTAFGEFSIVGGGERNIVGGDYSSLGGGQSNIVEGAYAVLGGGQLNYMDVNANGATISGGVFNTNLSPISVIAGGQNNRVMDFSGPSVIGGGINNLVGGHSGYNVIAGGEGNMISGATYGVIPGGMSNAVTASYSLAEGQLAKAATTGTFVWADSTGADFISTSNYQFLVRAAGGVGIGLNNPSAQLHVTSPGGDAFPQARLNQEEAETGYARLRFTVGGDVNKRWDIACRSNRFVIFSGQYSSEALALENNNAYVNGALVTTSDRNAKAGFEPVEPRRVLEKIVSLPISRWHYTNNPATPHIGPMAQDFYAAFGVGTDDRHIATVDADGVALAAIQGLNQKLESENAELRARLERLEQLISQRAK